MDVFAWSYKEMPGLDPKVVVHHLVVKNGTHPVKQAQRHFRSDLVPLIETEVNKLIEAGFIREVKYPTWVSSIVPLRKKNGQIRVCVDFMILNNACPKDEFPLPIPKMMIDATNGYKAMSFMDGSSGYNQILMAPKEEDLTASRIPKRAMQNIFDDLLHKNVECYVDDLVVKSRKRGDHLKDLRMVFELLRRYQLRMNPLKCAFGVTSGKFLGFIIRHRVIEIDQAKVDAILKMPKTRDIHELESLQGKLAYLRRFISNIAGRCQPFSRLMKKGVPFKWDQACSNAFESIKSYLMKPPILAAPIPRKSFDTIHCGTRKVNSIKFVMSKPVLSDQLARWYLQFQQFEILYILQKAVKGQALADFLVDHLIPDDWELTDELPDEEAMVVEVQPPWKMYFDGAAHRGGAGAGVVFVTSQGEVFPYSFTLTQLCSNNVAEYQLLVLGLEIAVDMKQLHLQVFGDSQLVVNRLLVVALMEVKKENLASFIRVNIIYHFSIPHYIITDNGKPFDNRLMNKICDLFGFKQRNSYMYNVAANGLAEAFNKTLCNLLKKVVSKSKRDWHDRMEEALWAYRTNHRTPMQATPYSLVYGVEAVLPLERQITSLGSAIQEGITDEENARL
ncbi:uncharacterized protein [Nicotiana sylvestris]|uniref:uncharacterized protein n=1 Tax=Nicotiana sylvestris TaxID=4096 RepID=UPI00388C8A2B